jgi:hypothetical protein
MIFIEIILPEVQPANPPAFDPKRLQKLGIITSNLKNFLKSRI